MPTRAILLTRAIAHSIRFTSKLQKKMISPGTSQSNSIPQPQMSASRRHISSISRLPRELSCLGSMMPLHSAIASARLNSILSAESQSWGLIPQGISMPL